MSIQKRKLGARGIQYVREQLTDAAPFSETLSRYLEGGYAWQFVPEEKLHSYEKLDFHIGGIDAITSALVFSKYVEFLCHLLMEDSSTVMLFENQLFRLTDPVMLSREGVFEYMGATYSYLQTKSLPATESAVAEHLRGASRYPSVVIVTRGSELMSLHEVRQLTAEEAHELGAHVQHILVGAYDEEAYVVWSLGRCPGL